MSETGVGPWAGRLAEPALALAILAGSLGLVAMPAAWLWLLSQLGLTYAEVFVLALIGTPIPLICWGWILVRLNRFYVTRFEQRARPALEAGAVLAVLVASGLFVWLVIMFGSGGDRAWPV